MQHRCRITEKRISGQHGLNWKGARSEYKLSHHSNLFKMAIALVAGCCGALTSTDDKWPRKWGWHLIGALAAELPELSAICMLRVLDYNYTVFIDLHSLSTCGVLPSLHSIGCITWTICATRPLQPPQPLNHSQYPHLHLFQLKQK